MSSKEFEYVASKFIYLFFILPTKKIASNFGNSPTFKTYHDTNNLATQSLKPLVPSSP